MKFFVDSLYTFSEKGEGVFMVFLESDFKRICPTTCLRSPRKVFVDIRDTERYTDTHINLRARHKKRDPSARNSLFLVSPFSKKEIDMIFNEKTRCQPRGFSITFLLRESQKKSFKETAYV